MFPEDLTWRDVEEYVEAGKRLLLLPVGSLEGHGYHLPLNTDAIIASEIAKRVAQNGGFISIPPVTYTLTLLKRPGNVKLSTVTFKGVITEIIESFVKFNLKRFIIVLGHGGPDVRETLIGAASELIANNPDIGISILHIRRIIPKVSSLDTSKDTHAGEWETSLMLYLRPEVVGEERVTDFSS